MGLTQPGMPPADNPGMPRPVQSPAASIVPSYRRPTPAPRLSDAPSGRMTMLPPDGWQPSKPAEPTKPEIHTPSRRSDAPSGRMTMLPYDPWAGR